MTDIQWSNLWKEYEHQSEIVHRESDTLRFLNGEIQKFRKICEHDWKFSNGLKICKLCKFSEIDNFDENL